MNKILIRELVDIISGYLDIKSIINFHKCYNYPLSVKWLLVYESLITYKYRCGKCHTIEFMNCNLCDNLTCNICANKCEFCEEFCCDKCTLYRCNRIMCIYTVCINCIMKCRICKGNYCREHMKSSSFCHNCH